MLILGGNILLSLMIGVCMGMPGYCVLFLCMLVPLRSDAGGYHAPNLFICYLLSFASLILTMFWAKEKVYKETSQNSCVSGVDHRGTATACQPSCRLYSMERNCVEWSGIYSMVSGKKNRGKR